MKAVHTPVRYTIKDGPRAEIDLFECLSMVSVDTNAYMIAGRGQGRSRQKETTLHFPTTDHTAKQSVDTKVGAWKQ